MDLTAQFTYITRVKISAEFLYWENTVYAYVCTICCKKSMQTDVQTKA